MVSLGRIRRIFILALDALEYNLVIKYKLKPLLQRTYGYIDVSYFKRILTPTIWVSFITGKDPRQHNVRSWWKISKVDALDTFVHLIYYKIPLLRKLSASRIKSILRLFGIRVRPIAKEDLHIKTIFDIIHPSIALFVPGYNEEAWIRDVYSKALNRGVNELEKVVWYIYEYRKTRLFKTLLSRKEWKLFMVWFDLADWMGHLYMGKSNLKIFKTYLELSRLAARIKRNLSKDTLFMVVSDHGMNPRGEHSPRAFYSFSESLNWRPKKITDYYAFIKSLLLTGDL